MRQDILGILMILAILLCWAYIKDTEGITTLGKIAKTLFHLIFE